jgi:hypothetical protein
MRASHSILLAAVLGMGCAHPPRAFTFTTPAPGSATVDRVAASLARQGHSVSAVDRRGSEVTTYWEDTGYRYRETDDLEDETTIFLRFHVDVRPATGGQEISVRAEAQRCVPSRAVVTRSEVLSTCIKMNRLLATHQWEVDELGRRLAASLAGPG